MSEQSHRSDPQVLNRRTLQRDDRRLADLLRPGMAVLDVGCGTGAITVGIARMVGLEGQVLGLDRDDSLLAIARQEHQGVDNLSFQNGDVLSMRFEGRFDIVTAARMLQWIGEPDRAIRRMRDAAKTGGYIVVLDYNHEDNSWAPAPPAEFGRFYRAFLEWRTANKWDNRIADRLPRLLHLAGATDVRIHLDDEIVERGDPNFFVAAAIWSHVIQSIGPQIVRAGFLGEHERFQAEERYQQYLQTSLQRQMLSMRTAVGRVP